MNESYYITEFGFRDRNPSRLNVWFGPKGDRFFTDLTSRDATWICALDDSLTVEELFPGLNFIIHEVEGSLVERLRVYIPSDEETNAALKLIVL